MTQAIQLLALLTLFFASPRRAAAVALTSQTPSPDLVQPAGVYDDAPPCALESRNGLLCHNDPVNHTDPTGLVPDSAPLNSESMGTLQWGDMPESYRVGVGVGFVAMAVPAAIEAGSIALSVRGAMLARAAGPAAIAANRLNHIFGKPEHQLGGLLKAFGSEKAAFAAAQKAANQALAAGKLTPNAQGILPSGDAGNIINVGGTTVRLLGGKVEDGVVKISSLSRKGL